MYKIIISTIDSCGEGFDIKEDFETEADAWAWWDKESDQYPEMTWVWVEKQTMLDEFGQEAVDNVSAGENLEYMAIY